jgi:hypothetical protein
MGIVLGGDAGGTAIGVAPMAKWIAVKIYDDSGRGTLSGIHLGFQWLLDPDGDPDTDDAPDVVNGSWGLLNTVGECDAEFAADLAALRAADVSVVFSAGNSGPDAGTSVSPANDPLSFAVGATNEASGVAGMSSRGPSACGGLLYPRVVAPGVNVRTADLTFGIFPDSYVSVTGTSFAAPHVSGAVALLRSAFPSASASAIEAALAGTAVDLGTAGPDMEAGAGLVDVRAAYALLEALQRPMAADDAYGTERDAPLVVPAPGVLGNDLEPQGEPMAAVLVRDVTAGTLELDAGGGFAYTPAAGFVGTDSFAYAASDGGHASSAATVTLTVTEPPPVNRPPTASDDAASTPEDTPATLDVLSNDADADGDGLTIARATQGAHGTVAASGLGLVYTPNRDFHGTDAFTYVASDGTGESAPATVTVVVTSVNDAPTAVDDGARTTRNVRIAIAVLANDGDVDGRIAPGTVAILTRPAHGRAMPSRNGTVTYAPRVGFTGIDAFTYTVRDDAGAFSNEATVRVIVDPRPRPGLRAAALLR